MENVEKSDSQPGPTSGQAELIAKITTAILQLAAILRRARAEKDDLSHNRHDLLTTLQKEGPQSVPQLARRRNCSRQTVQLAINRLCAMGLVRKQDNPGHRRSLLIALTLAGQERITDGEPAEIPKAFRALHEMSSGELQQLGRLLSKLHKTLRGASLETKVDPLAQPELPQAEESVPEEIPIALL